ncbi:MAG: rod shape-determining protein MreC [Solirubrobacterales bacterium]
MYRKQVRRRRAVLALLILSSFALLTATYGEQSGGLQRGVSAVFGPLQEGADRALKPARDLVNWFDETFDARGENDRLRDEVENLRTQVAAGETALSENNQLRKLLGLRAAGELPLGFEPVTGRVIARSPTVWYSSVTIDHGTSAGVRVDDPVISGDGLVGRITSATPGTAQVTLITDHTSAVSAKVVPAGIQGVIKPEVGNPADLVLDFIDSSKHARVGQTVVTSGWKARGLTSLYPYGIPLGRVTRATVAEQEASQQVHVRPFADLRELEFVQVLTK